VWISAPAEEMTPSASPVPVKQDDDDHIRFHVVGRQPTGYRNATRPLKRNKNKKLDYVSALAGFHLRCWMHFDTFPGLDARFRIVDRTVVCLGLVTDEQICRLQ